jgi:nucleoside-diphosphate-sugar epimerase
MSSILVFGASGSVGRFALPVLAGDHRLTAVSRSKSGGGWLQAGLEDKIVWPDVEIVLSLGPLDAFSAWLEKYRGPSLRRVIALSSMSAETKRDSADPQEQALAQRLRDAEDSLARTAAARGIDWTIFRPTMIYGAGTDRNLTPIARFMRRWRVLPIPFSANGLRQPVHAADVAQACFAALAEPAAFGKTYPLGGGERLSFRDILWRLRAGSPGFVLPLPVPRFVLSLAARWRPDAGISRAALQRLDMDLIADNVPANRDFGYAPCSFSPSDAFVD